MSMEYRSVTSRPTPMVVDEHGRNASTISSVSEDAEFEDIKRRVLEIEAEAEAPPPNAPAEQAEAQRVDVEQAAPVAVAQQQQQTFPTPAEIKEADSRSIYVGNVEYSTTAEELEAHFHGCGAMNRVTIMCDKFSGHPKGFAYVEFANPDSVQTALALDDSLFKSRNIKVMAKRTNRPGVSSTDRLPRRGGFSRRMPTGGYPRGGGGHYRGRMGRRGRFVPAAYFYPY